MGAPDLEFELLPADDEGLAPDEARGAAVAGAVGEAVAPEAEPPPVPFGRSWTFDFTAGRFVRAGSSPVPATGFAALEQWVLMVAHTARYAHRVFSDEFGMEHPEAGIGELEVAAMISDYEQHLREAILVHDRVTGLENFKASYDSTEGVLTIESFDVVTDEEDVVPVTDVTLGRAEVFA